MKNYWTLYCKEMKRILSVVIFLVLLYGVFLLFHLFGIVQYTIKNYLIVFYYLIIIGTIWAAPFLFAYSLYEEWNSQTKYQIHSLPVKRFSPIFNKYLAAITIAIVTTAGTTACNYIISYRTYRMSPILLPVEWYSIVTRLLILNFWLLGIACATAGIVFSISKYRFIVIVMLVPALISLTIKVDTFAKPFLAGVRGYIISNLHFYPNLVWFIIGFVYLFIGLVFFEKFAEI